MHIGSQIFALKSFSAAIQRMVAFMGEIATATGRDVRLLDTGGGLRHPVRTSDEPSTIEDFGKVNRPTASRRSGEKRRLPVAEDGREPGRSVVANAGVTLYTVGRHQGDPEDPHLRRGWMEACPTTSGLRCTAGSLRALIADKADQAA